ncbi:MAG: Ribonuclease VapC11 [Chroococcidiopsis cubana SAG 39.79]|uniref:Ribonuclease VapC n=1 Tax=Chroococcidiopsis cubana SAG 39.79 TaxID=388085 RepID=A0AB37UKJ1_9CYAN|nr:PIN domain nuclease [Chroococcidiopsis cubana]MDZ4871312.1 Ribonuclease VapC11 [Chroococcidiopsis cubana SAG 39.79]PSB63024.1 VapC toxin family PIN domain ribonuclease [Chroococcidiopsis cubana CCALA 043]RUT11927.1 ribonuclease VapC [Chroococcidiopsis cubana SAG 39.79]
MLLIDTSVWVSVFRDKTGLVRQQLQSIISDRDVILTRFSQLELLQGCRDDREWRLLHSYLQAQDYVELDAESWQAAARIYFELRRQGLTVCSPINCCIAQLAIDHALTLIHDDRDFEVISSVRSLQQIRFQPK